MTLVEQNRLFSSSDDESDEVASAAAMSIDELCHSIREELLEHLRFLGLNDHHESSKLDRDSKDTIRAFHSAQRAQVWSNESAFVAKYGRYLLNHFADGSEVQPERVDPVVYLITQNDENAALFRVATMLWSVPVSRGYGRRMRFLVRDRSNGKLIGIFALADPVFNLRARDNWIGWTVDDRRERLVNVMDAHVVGAVPPYSFLLGGKVVASLMTSQEVCAAFAAKYMHSEGVISHQRKHAQLTLVTVTSALGRSSLYNRLRLPGIMDFTRIGMTEGWGHFQVPDNLFILMRELLEREGHKYASGHQFGQGPNWRMRVVRAALIRIGLDPNLLRHGVAREIYASPLATNWREFLCGKSLGCVVNRPSAEEIGHAAVVRWLEPRAIRRPDYKGWTREDTWRLIHRSDDLTSAPIARSGDEIDG